MRVSSSNDPITDFDAFQSELPFYILPKDVTGNDWHSVQKPNGVFFYTLASNEEGNGTIGDGALLSVQHSILVNRQLRLKIVTNAYDVTTVFSDGRLGSYMELFAIMRAMGSETPEENYQLEHLEFEALEQSEEISDGEQQQKSFLCSFCMKSFSRSISLRDHENTHTGEKPYVCDICSRAFAASTSLLSHRQLHFNVKNHLCPQCGKTFNRKRNMELHQRLIHKKEKPYECALCGQLYTDRTCLKRHIARHSRVSDAAQEETGHPRKALTPRKASAPKAPSRRDPKRVPKEKFKVRQKRNTGPKPFECEQCGNMFARRRNVEHHIKYTHTGTKPYLCNHCGKRYSDITSFKRHQRSHTDAPENGGPSLVSPTVANVAVSRENGEPTR